MASVKDEGYFRDIVSKLVNTRERTKGELSRLGFTFPDTKTNFIFATHQNVPARELFAALRENGIYVRYWDKPRISNYLRISIGTDKEMDTVIGFLENYLKDR